MYVTEAGGGGVRLQQPGDPHNGSASYMAHLLHVIVMTETSPASALLPLAMHNSIKTKVGKEIFNYSFYKLPLMSLPRLKTAFLFQTAGVTVAGRRGGVY